MHHYFEALTNTVGQSLIGYFARVIDPATQAVVTLASDNNGTPISVVSGVANMAKTDDFGNVSLYVEPGTYNLEIYGPDAKSFLFRVPNVAMNSSKGDPGDPGPQGEQGEGLADVMAPTGGSLVGFKAKPAYAPPRSTLDKAQETISVLDFGAIGDNTAHPISEWIIPGVRGRYASLADLQADYPHVTSANDYIDWAAIQAAMTYVASINGGDVYLPKSGGRYVINKTLRGSGNNIRLRGPAPVRFPFNAGNTQSTALVADFGASAATQWVIDFSAPKAGAPLAYNDFFTGALPSSAFYDCSVSDLLVTSLGPIPYGGVRFAAVPGSTTQNLGVHRVGTGLLVNCCFGGNYSVHALTAYYGFVGWDDFNGNNVEAYVARDGAYTGDVPSAYQLKPMQTLGETLTNATYGMASSAHTARSTGIMVGSLGSTSNNNTISFVTERFGTGEFLLYANSLGHTKAYTEASSMDTVIAAAFSTLTHSINHSYTSGTGALLDVGKSADLDLRLNGSLFVGSFGAVSTANTTHVLIRTVSSEQIGGFVPQYNIVFERPGQFITPSLLNGATNIAGDDITPGYRKERERVYLQGTLTVATSGVPVWNLPQGNRPFARVRGNGFVINTSGDIIPTGTGTLFLQGFSFEAF